MIGTVVSADVRLTAPDVAPIHAVLEIEGAPSQPSGQATIYDLASESGVFVGTERVVTRRLKPGDRITIGGVELGFSVDELSDILARGGSRTRETGLDGRKLFLDPERGLLGAAAPRGRRPCPADLRLQALRDARALEVVMAWKGTILDVEHFVKEREVTIGSSRENDFGIPPILGCPVSAASRQGEDSTTSR